MIMIIKDGTGQSYSAGVNKENRLETKSVTTNFTQHINEVHGKAYSLIIDKTPTGAGDCFCYIKNNSESDMFITALCLHAANDEIIDVKIGDTGTPVGGSAATPVNRNAGSGNVADGTFETGVDITGLSGGSIVDKVGFDSSTDSYKHRWDSAILLPKNKILTLYAVNGAIALKGSLSIMFCC